jgi:GntR family transcriptional regulator
VQEQGRSPRQEIRVEILEAEPTIAARLALVDGALVVVRRRLRFVDDAPCLIADSYYPEAIVRGSAVARPADIKAGARHVLAELGHRWVTHDDEIEGRHPTDEEARLLGIPPGLAVIVHTRTSSNADGVPSRCMLSVFPVDRWRLLYRVEG